MTTPTRSAAEEDAAEDYAKRDALNAGVFCSGCMQRMDGVRNHYSAGWQAAMQQVYAEAEKRADEVDEVDGESVIFMRVLKRICAVEE